MYDRCDYVSISLSVFLRVCLCGLRCVLFYLQYTLYFLYVSITCYAICVVYTIYVLHVSFFARAVLPHRGRGPLPYGDKWGRGPTGGQRRP